MENRYTRAEDKIIVRMRNQGKTYKEIASKINRSEASVNSRVNKVLTRASSYDDIDYGTKAKSTKKPMPDSYTDSYPIDYGTKGTKKQLPKFIEYAGCKWYR